jgi:hypothetical protein
MACLGVVFFQEKHFKHRFLGSCVCPRHVLISRDAFFLCFSVVLVHVNYIVFYQEKHLKHRFLGCCVRPGLALISRDEFFFMFFSGTCKLCWQMNEFVSGIIKSLLDHLDNPDFRAT